MAKIKHYLISFLSVLSMMILPAMLSSSTEITKEEIILMGDLNMIDARNAVKVTIDTPGNLDILFKQPIGLVTIKIERSDGEKLMTKKVFTDFTDEVKLNVANVDSDIYTLSISDSYGSEALGSFAR